MITDRSRRQEVLFPIDHNYNEIYDNLGFFKSKHKKFREFFFGGRVKKSHLNGLCARAMARTVQLTCA